MDRFDLKARKIVGDWYRPAEGPEPGEKVLSHYVAAAIRAEYERAGKMRQALEMCINNPITAYELSVARAAIREYEDAQ